MEHGATLNEFVIEPADCDRTQPRSVCTRNVKVREELTRRKKIKTERRTRTTGKRVYGEREKKTKKETVDDVDGYEVNKW